MDDYFLELKRGSPIRYGELTFYPISFKEICDVFGFDKFNEYMLPFCMTSDYVDNLQIEDLKSGYDLFEDVLLKDSQLLFYMVNILTIFCKIHTMYKRENQLEICDKNDDTLFQINKDNFDDISEILLKLTCKSKIKIEKPPTNLSERQLDIWKKLHGGRERYAKKNELHIYDILNYCEYAGNYHIPIEEIESWTIWRIYNCYNSKTGQLAYRDNLLIGLAAHDLKDIDGDKHWSKRLMIRN